jgi:hypothetical protein
MKAFIGEANFQETPTGELKYFAHIMYQTTGSRYNASDIEVPVLDSDTGNTFINRLMTYIDNEAARLSLPAPTLVFGHQLAKFR